MYQTYIFDLYETLLDIHTDEDSLFFWTKMADLYACYGAVYDPEEMKDMYRKFCREEEIKTKKEGITYPEIDLTAVFERLLKEAPSAVCVPYSIASMKRWSGMIANTFRVLSRDRLKPYKNVLETLQKLKDEGKRIILCSNAQAAFTETELAVTGLTDYFDGIYLSSDYGVRKPDRLFLDYVVKNEKLNVKECLFIGNDFVSDISMAYACGMDSAFLNTYRFSEERIHEEIETIRTDEEIRIHVIQDIKELPAIKKGESRYGEMAERRSIL